ncbi:MAG: UDP-N-acetylmuramoyl-tripeptide--D-alanyl-D-alanine ligase, partial [Candidatus Omnitrophica bacterium]|nr:UDP-N-acetylmuramoyl-tripeptide--D-alanyl-D-alanine ligase [Candidatus Omnitrophota bacterium]
SSGITLINDAYNANPDSFKRAIETFKHMNSKGKKIVIAGDMLELGESSEKFHFELGRDIQRLGFDYLIAIGEYANFTLAGARLYGMIEQNLDMAYTNQEIVNKLRGLLVPGDIVLIKGSRRMRLEEIVKCFITSCTL